MRNILPNFFQNAKSNFLKCSVFPLVERTKANPEIKRNEGATRPFTKFKALNQDVSFIAGIRKTLKM